ncbi:MAG: hypothetical protein KJS45_02155 [Bacteroidetes bacterium]|nr:hypothetical protein [Bacteroidota bacterium]
MRLGKWLLLLIFCFNILFSSCFFKRKTTCPAYMKGSVTGTGGSNSKKKQELFPKKMKRK